MLTDNVWIALFSGTLVGLGMMLSVGPRTLLLIHLGATSRHCWLTATLGFCSDALIFFVALSTIGTLLQTFPDMVRALQILGIGFLVWCGLRVRNSQGKPATDTAPGRPSLRKELLQMLSVTWLNPLVYLEVGLIAGSVSLGFDGQAKSAFAMGYLGASAIKYYGWTLLGRQLETWLASGNRMSGFNILSSTILFTLAASLTWHCLASDLAERVTVKSFAPIVTAARSVPDLLASQSVPHHRMPD